MGAGKIGFVFIVLGLLLFGCGGGEYKPKESPEEVRSSVYWSSAIPFSIAKVNISSNNGRITLVNRLNQELVLTGISFDGKAVYNGADNFAAGEEKTIIIEATCNQPGGVVQYNDVALTYNQDSFSEIKQKGDKSLVVACST